MPATNVEYWRQKIARNQQRDAEHLEQLIALGWQVLVVWECQVKDIEELKRKLHAFLQ